MAWAILLEQRVLCASIARIRCFTSAFAFVGIVTVSDDVIAEVSNGQVNVDLRDELNWAVLRQVNGDSMIVTEREGTRANQCEGARVLVYVHLHSFSGVDPRVELKLIFHTTNELGGIVRIYVTQRSAPFHSQSRIKSLTNIAPVADAMRSGSSGSEAHKSCRNQF